MKDNSSPFFFSSDLIFFGQKEPTEVKFSHFWVVRWKFTKFLMWYLKTQVSFSLNFLSLFIVMKDNSSVFFSWNFIRFGQKEPMKVQNFRLPTAHMKFHQFCTLIGSFCWKYIQFQLTSREELCLMTLRSDAKFEEKLICCFKNDKNLVNFDPSTQKSWKICTLIGPFHAKYISFDL